MSTRAIEFEDDREKIFPHIYRMHGRMDCPAAAPVIGIDPGVNFGFTYIDKTEVTVTWGKLESHSKEPGYRGIRAYEFINLILMNQMKAEFSIVEGAAYNSRFGQVGLEEVRFGFFLALYHAGLNVRIVPPATIRKLAFGSGKIQAGDVWPELNHNAADSVGIALAALEQMKRPPV